MNKLSKVFTTYDRASEAYSPPFVAPHEGVAIRGFTDAVNDPQKQSDLSKHPEDFDLYCIGEFDSERGILLPDDDPLARKPILRGKALATLPKSKKP